MLERKTRTARKSLGALLLKRGPLSEKAGAVAALGRTTSDFNAAAQFESEGGITVVFMACYFRPCFRPSPDYKGFSTQWFQRRR
jgi:hypothetical protein